MNSYVTDTQALVKFMMGKKVINNRSHQAFIKADNGEGIIIIPAIVLMEVLVIYQIPIIKPAKSNQIKREITNFLVPVNLAKAFSNSSFPTYALKKPIK